MNAGAFGTEMSSNQFGTDGSSLQLNETLLEENNVEKILGTLLDGLNFEADEAASKIEDDGTPAVRSRLAEIEPGKRKSKPTDCCLAYQKKKKEEENCTPDYSGNQVQWISSYIRSEILRLLGSRCSRLTECSIC